MTTVVVLNRAAHAQPFDLVDTDSGLSLRSLSAPAHSILTLRYNASALGAPAARVEGPLTLRPFTRPVRYRV